MYQLLRTFWFSMLAIPVYTQPSPLCFVPCSLLQTGALHTGTSMAVPVCYAYSSASCSWSAHLDHIQHDTWPHLHLTQQRLFATGNVIALQILSGERP